jgi:hypothetical protein
MKKRRLLRTGSALALLLSLGLVAACEEAVEEPVVEDPVVEEPAVQEPVEPQEPAPTTPGQSPTMQEPAEEPGGMEMEEEEQPAR